MKFVNGQAKFDGFTIWEPVDSSSGYQISDSGGWYPGIFDDSLTALAAVRLANPDSAIGELQARVNTRGSGLITMADVATYTPVVTIWALPPSSRA